MLAALVMSAVLQSIGFFQWSANNLVMYARGSGIRLFAGILVLCCLLTLFFNHYASIFITTPIILQIGGMLRLRIYQQIPYLISGAIIAIAAAAPVGASQFSSLITMSIVGMNINDYVELIFVPAMLGIVTIAWMLYLCYRKQLPLRIPAAPEPSSRASQSSSIDWPLFRICMLVVVVTRAGFFIGSSFGVPAEWIAIAGSLLLLIVRWWKTGRGPVDVLSQTPWHILLFAFSIYVIVDALQGTGITRVIATELSSIGSAGKLSVTMAAGGLLTVMSGLLNNLPSALIGTLSLTHLNLEPQTAQLAYLASILGSDIGALITPVGTLASLIWLFILRQHNIQLSWKDYMLVTAVVIPTGLLASLLSLYVWTRIIG